MERLFLGFSENVNVVPVPGVAHAVRGFESDAASRELVQLRFAPASFLGPDYATLVMPAIPSLDYITLEGGELPRSLRKPLLKTAQQSELSVLRSGRRSALLIDGDHVYRLKGCGNLLEGFPLQKTEKGFDEIRGCTFAHTAQRELALTSLVSEKLAAHGVQCANRALGWWQYEVEEEARYRKLARCCALFETLGDRRMGDHLLVPLEQLLPWLVCDACDAPLAAAFGDRMQDGAVSETWLRVICGGVPINFALQSEAFGACERVQPNEIIEHSQLSNEQRAVLEKHAHELLTLKHNVVVLLTKLFWQLGFECGRVLRILHQAGISWGTYDDLLGTHCNAHANNLVVLPLNDAAHLLAPLDFDMAFTHETYHANNAVPTPFEQCIELEIAGLRQTLAGDAQLNTGATGSAALPSGYANARWALRDTLTAGFLEGYEDRASVRVTRAEYEDMHKLVRVALALSGHVIS